MLRGDIDQFPTTMWRSAIKTGLYSLDALYPDDSRPIYIYIYIWIYLKMGTSEHHTVSTNIQTLMSMYNKAQRYSGKCRIELYVIYIYIDIKTNSISIHLYIDTCTHTQTFLKICLHIHIGCNYCACTPLRRYIHATTGQDDSLWFHTAKVTCHHCFGGGGTE